MINDESLDLIKEYEGLSLTTYLCSGNYWTIGFGAIYAINGERVKKSDPAITEAHATELLRRDVNIAYRSVARLTAPYTEDLTDNQMGALTSLCFNIGSGNFRASSVRSNIVRGEIENAGKNFWQWRRANSRIVSGLVRRRARETQLYFS
tara:strand:- start:39 stop:488 length:450 start_codon:yes stop_codon:yes gene_type:complete